METVDRERRRIARSVTRTLRHPDFRGVFDLVDDDGVHPFIAVVPGDQMRLVFERLKAAGGSAYLATIDSGMLKFASMVKHTRGRHAEEANAADSPCPIHPESTVGVLFDYLEAAGRPVVCHEANPDVELELVRDVQALNA